MHRVGFDLGGTKIEGIVIDPHGREIFRQRIPTDAHLGYEHILGQVRRLHDSMAPILRGAPHAIGLGTAGFLFPPNGRLRSFSIPALNDRPLRADIERLLRHPVGIQNDANCFAIAEAALGAARGVDTVMGLIIGTGCGGGIVRNGRIIDGLHARAGEWGHMSIDPNGPTCPCGRRGCVQTLISGKALENRYAQTHGAARPLKEIEADYNRGDPAAADFFAPFFRHFGIAVANLITILDPDIIVIGGGVSNFKAIYTEGVKEVARNILGDELETPIVPNQLGDSAGVLGAALIGI